MGNVISTPHASPRLEADPTPPIAASSPDETCPAGLPAIGSGTMQEKASGNSPATCLRSSLKLDAPSDPPRVHASIHPIYTLSIFALLDLERDPEARIRPELIATHLECATFLTPSREMPAQTAREPPSLWPQCGRTRTLVEFAASCASPVSPNDGSDTDSQFKLFPSAISEYWMRHGQILGFCGIALQFRLPASLQSVMSSLLVFSARKHSSPYWQKHSWQASPFGPFFKALSIVHDLALRIMI